MTDLTVVQKKVVEQMRQGAVIGELSELRNGRYELFVRKANWTPRTGHPCENPFIVKRINKNTVFALLAIGLIRNDNTIAETMRPFVRDTWYVYDG